MSTLTLSFTPTESTPCPASPSTPSTTRVSACLAQLLRNVVDTSIHSGVVRQPVQRPGPRDSPGGGGHGQVQSHRPRVSPAPRSGHIAHIAAILPSL